MTEENMNPAPGNPPFMPVVVEVDPATFAAIQEAKASGESIQFTGDGDVKRIDFEPETDAGYQAAAEACEEELDARWAAEGFEKRSDEDGEYWQIPAGHPIGVMLDASIESFRSGEGKPMSRPEAAAKLFDGVAQAASFKDLAAMGETLVAAYESMVMAQRAMRLPQLTEDLDKVTAAAITAAEVGEFEKVDAYLKIAAAVRSNSYL